MDAQQLVQLAVLVAAFCAGWFARGAPRRPVQGRPDERHAQLSAIGAELNGSENGAAVEALKAEARSALEGAIAAYHDLVSASATSQRGPSLNGGAVALAEPVSRLGRALDAISMQQGEDDNTAEVLGEAAVELAEITGRLSGRSPDLEALLDRLEQALVDVAGALLSADERALEPVGV